MIYLKRYSVMMVIFFGCCFHFGDLQAAPKSSEARAADVGSFFIEGNAKKEKLVSKSDKSESKIDNKDKKESKSVTNEEKTSKKDAIKSLETKKEVKKDKTELSNEKSESKKSMDIEIEGMVEVSSLQKNQTEGISVWTVFPLEMDVEGKKTLKNTHQMMRLNGTLVQKSGKTTFKVKSYKLLDD